MHRGPNSSAFRTPSHFATGWGGFQRNVPTGGAANGIPLKTFTSALDPVMPDTRPESSLTGSGTAAGIDAIAEKVSKKKRRNENRFIGVSFLDRREYVSGRPI